MFTSTPKTEPKKPASVTSLDDVLQATDSSSNLTVPPKKKKRVTPTKIKDLRNPSDITLEQAWQDKRNENYSKTGFDDDIEKGKVMEDRKALVLVGRSIGRLDGLDSFKTLTNLDLSNNNIGK